MVATNVVASRPPNGDRLQRRRLCQYKEAVHEPGETNVLQNTSLVVPGALDHHLQRRTVCKNSGGSKMADRVYP